MQVSDKLIKPLTEIKYLNADYVSRYRCIIGFFLITMIICSTGCIRKIFMKK